MTNSVAPAPHSGEREYPPSVWVCPKCSSRVITHITTFGVVCHGPTHTRTRVPMEVHSEDQ